MYLKSLEVQGFKSFPDKTVIRFGDDITAIVGPNGSGKSNISDAILWVLGEQSSKTLRGAKMEDVIFGGTQKRKAVGFAEATLILDNTDRALAYDADEVMITRRYYRSGDSEYYLNRQSARLKDINELFMDTGLGREGYSNIGQGRIDEILALKSTDRREIFEEAAGISKYRHRKEETERKLATTDDNLMRIGDKVSELELQLEPLLRQSEKAQQFLALKEELRGLEIALWLDSLERLSAAAKKADEDYNSASFVLRQAHDDLEGLYHAAEQAGILLRQKDEELENARVQVSMLDAAHQQFDGQIAVLKSNIENNQSNISRIETELSGQAERSGGIGAQIDSGMARVSEIEQRLEGKKQLIESLQKNLSDMTADAQGMTRQFLELRSAESELVVNLAGCEADLRTAEENLSRSSERLAQLEETSSAGSARKTDTEQALNTCRKQLSEAEDAVVASRNMISGYQLRQNSRKNTFQQLDASVRDLSGQLDAVSTRVRVFQAMERDFDSYQKSVRLVMQQAQKGGLKNIHGPVSRLIRTADEYTVAVEIALGGALQQIVVEQEQDAKAAISFLKRVGGGRATFLPLNTIQPRSLQESGLERCRGFVGIASDLVSCQDCYRGVVSSLLGRIVIVEDLDCGIAMARAYRNRFKIVTLDGQVMNAGGSMTGGSVNKEAGILSKANELERLSRRQAELRQQMEEKNSALQEAKRQLDQVSYQIETAADQLREAEDQVLRLQGQEKQYEILLQAVCEAQENAAREKQELQNRQDADHRSLDALKVRISLYQQQLEQLRRKLTDLDASQSAASRQSAGISDQLAAARADEAALMAERTTALSHIEDLRSLRSAIEGDREKQQMMILHMQEETQRLHGQISGLQASQAENDRLADDQRKKLQQVLTSRAETEASKTRAERDAQEKNKDILKMERACALLEQKKATTALEERQIIDKLWDTYGLTPGTAADQRTEVESGAAGTRKIGELKRKITALGTPNLGAIEEYARVNERYTYLTAQRDDVLNSKKELESIIRDITREMTVIFVEQFQRIDQYFGETFTEMFGGGKGKLILDDPENPLTCGIEIRVQPPGKQVKTITLLSGGEKAFVAIALYFSILKVRPTPFCMLDEIDAALDDRNVERFAGYLHNLCRKTQFIVITHRRGTMEAADVLYGVTMQEQGVSKLLRLDLNQMEEYLGIME